MQLWLPIRRNGIRRVGSITTTKCYKGQRRGSIKAQKEMVLHASAVDSRLQSSLTPSEASCFFCGQAAGTDGLHNVTTFQMDQRVHESAELTEESLLLAKLSLTDMVALEAKYHTKCLLALYNCARKGVVHTASARRLDSNALLSANVKENVQQTEQRSVLYHTNNYSKFALY